MNPEKKQRLIPGTILEIVSEKKYYYAQILQSKNCAFFDLEQSQPIDDLKLLNEKPILFSLRVYDDVIVKGRWKKVGKLSIRESLQIEPMQFIQDVLNLNSFELYNPNSGEIIKATREQCIGLEAAAVWEAEHVEERLHDHFQEKTNRWVEQLSIK